MRRRQRKTGFLLFVRMHDLTWLISPLTSDAGTAEAAIGELENIDASVVLAEIVRWVKRRATFRADDLFVIFARMKCKSQFLALTSVRMHSRAHFYQRTYCAAVYCSIV